MTGEITYGRIPAGSVVVSGNLPSKDGTHSLYCNTHTRFCKIFWCVRSKFSFYFIVITSSTAVHDAVFINSKVQAGPTIIEDNCFIGARSEIVEGVVVEEGSVISMGVYIGQSTKIFNLVCKKQI
jgi:tetrahydrodipicolinate N-succinyltransferase